MKKKKIMKKCLALFLTVLAFAASMSVTSSAATIVAPNRDVNTYDSAYNITVGTKHYVDGYMSSALSNDFQFGAMTVAGKVSGSSKKSVNASISSDSSATRNFKVTTKNPSGSTIPALTYSSGTGTNTGSDAYVQKIAFTIYYILVDVEVKATLPGKVYKAYPNITERA